MDQDLRTDVEVFLTLKHLDPHTHQHIVKNNYFFKIYKNTKNKYEKYNAAWLVEKYNAAINSN